MGPHDRQGAAALLLVIATLLLGLGVYAVIYPHGYYSISTREATVGVTPGDEAGRTVTTKFPNPVLLGDSGPLSRYSVSFSNPIIANYSTWYKNGGGKGYPALVPQNYGRTEVTVTQGSHVVTFALVVRPS